MATTAGKHPCQEFNVGSHKSATQYPQAPSPLVSSCKPQPPNARWIVQTQLHVHYLPFVCAGDSCGKWSPQSQFQPLESKVGD